MIYLIPLLLFALIVLLSLTAYDYQKNRREGKEMVMKIRFAETGAGEHEEESWVLLSGVKKHLVHAISAIGKLTKPKGEKEASRMRTSLIRAGFRRQSAPAVFYGVKVFSGVFFALLFLLVKFVTIAMIPPSYVLFFLLLSAISGYYLPDLYIRLRTTARGEELQRHFPDAVDLMVVCVEAGMGLDAAINRIGDEMKLSCRTLSEEFRLLSLELRAGKARKDALKNLALRTGLEDVQSLVTMLIQTDKFGTKVGQALRVFSDSMRTKRHQRAEEIAAKLPVKLVLPLILFIFPSLFFTILGPAFIQLYRTLGGR